MRNLHDIMNDQLEMSHPIYEGAIEAEFDSVDELEFTQYSAEDEAYA